MKEYFQVARRVPRPQRRWLQFGLRFLLLAMLFIAAVLGAFLSGQRSGYEQGYSDAKRRYAPQPMYHQVYNVQDLINKNANPSNELDALAKRLAKATAPQGWTNTGGPGAIETFPTNGSLVVSQTADGHAATKEYLHKLRQTAKEDDPQ